MSLAEDLREIRDLPEVKEGLKTFGNRDWRLDHLYWIQDADGNATRFNRYDVQRQYCRESHVLDIILKSRQLGFSTEIAIEMLDLCLIRPNTAAGIVDYKLEDAKKKLQKVKFAYDRLLPEIREAFPLVKDNEDELWFANGSTIVVGTSHRGGTLQFLHSSELGKTAADNPKAAIEIVAGAFGTLKPGQRIVVESTAHGTSGKFYDLVREAEAHQKEGRPLSPVDFKLHFFGWHRHPGYRVASNLVLVPAELRAYFEDLEHAHGIRTDADQRAWYTAKHKLLGPDRIREEYPSHPSECFYSSLEGAYFKAEMSKARQDGRVGQALPYDRSRRVNTFWDIGEDMTAIWFHQTDGLRHRMIDYYEESGGSIQSAAALLDRKARERGFIYGKHIGPHDLENREWAANAVTKKDIAKDLGVDFQVVPRVDVKANSIEAARRMIGLTWFDAEHCARGVECLDNYSKKWNDRMGIWLPEPEHNVYSHGSDAYQQGAMGLVPERPEKTERQRPRSPRGTSHWSS